jgi:hypothetical protein
VRPVAGGAALALLGRARAEAAAAGTGGIGSDPAGQNEQSRTANRTLMQSMACGVGAAAPVNALAPASRFPRPAHPLSQPQRRTTTGVPSAANLHIALASTTSCRMHPSDNGVPSSANV